MNDKCRLQRAHDRRHFLTLRKGQYWGDYVDLQCSQCGLQITRPKSDIASCSDNGPVILRRPG